MDLIRQEIRMLRSQNEKLKEELKEYLFQDRVREVQQDVSRIRGLPVKEPLETDILTTEGVEKYIRREIKRQYPGDNLSYYEETLKKLGFIPNDTDLVKTLMDLYLEQVAGFYDDISGKFFVMESFDMNETITGIILAHEICHALQDQNFDLSKMGLMQSNNDDKSYAVLSVLEGDATILMMEWYQQNFTLGSLLGMVEMLGMDQSAFSETPYFIQNILIFPYIQGMNFMTMVMGHYGPDGRDIPLRNPPDSTEQILHPEKYYFEKDEPTVVHLPEGLSLQGRGWRQSYENSFGEMGIKLLFDQYVSGNQSREAAAGWDGDRYALFHKDDKFLILWDSVWDSSLDVEESMEAFHKVMQKRYGEFQKDEDVSDEDMSAFQITCGDDINGDDCYFRIHKGLRRIRMVLTSDEEAWRKDFLTMPLE